MDNAFIPLFPAAGPGTSSAELKLRPAGEASAGFQPVKPAGAAAPAGHPPEKPVITFERNGDRITQIKIQCSCGQIIELACDY